MRALNARKFTGLADRLEEVGLEKLVYSVEEVERDVPDLGSAS